ncbi:hypothetical protein [Streptomyces sp. NPDC005805]|uniref:hypothetical protein n=1 Tax=Streptomyces sp. NPDC005805 TaxID=3157068 RepID=UPI0033FB6AD3
MPARTRTRSHPQTPAVGARAARLPWWALALPVLAFAALLALIAGAGDAHATGSAPVVPELLAHLRDMLVR